MEYKNEKNIEDKKRRGRRKEEGEKYFLGEER